MVSTTIPEDGELKTSPLIFRCCSRKPSFLVIYSVAGEQKHYYVCSVCIHLECFTKYIIQKTPIHIEINKNFQKNFFEQTDESKSQNKKQTKESEIIKKFAEQSKSLSFHNEFKGGLGQ